MTSNEVDIPRFFGEINLSISGFPGLLPPKQPQFHLDCSRPAMDLTELSWLGWKSHLTDPSMAWGGEKWLETQMCPLTRPHLRLMFLAALTFLSKSNKAVGPWSSSCMSQNTLTIRYLTFHHIFGYSFFSSAGGTCSWFHNAKGYLGKSWNWCLLLPGSLFQKHTY